MQPVEHQALQALSSDARGQQARTLCRRVNALMSHDLQDLPLSVRILHRGVRAPALTVRTFLALEIRMKVLVRMLCAVVVLSAASAKDADAQLTWAWRFGTNSGTFTTTGSSYAAGNFTLLDFIVASSGDGATLGSTGGGQYAASGFGTVSPYVMQWDGSSATLWDSQGDNDFDWWVFSDIGNAGRYIFFGWETDNINTVGQGAYYDAAVGISGPSYALGVTPQRVSVPEPASVGLLATGLVGLVVARRRRTRA